MDIGAKIKEFRLSRGMMQKDLASHLHVSPQAVSSWEKNRTQPNMEMIEAMCKVFDCKKSDFLSDTPSSDIFDKYQVRTIHLDYAESPNVTIEVTTPESLMVQNFRMLSENDKRMIMRLIRLMRYAQIGGFKENTDSVQVVEKKE